MQSFWHLCWGVPVLAQRLAPWQGVDKCLLTKQAERKQAFGPCAVPTDNFMGAYDFSLFSAAAKSGVCAPPVVMNTFLQGDCRFSMRLCKSVVTNCAAKSWRAEADLHP